LVESEWQSDLLISRVQGSVGDLGVEDKKEKFSLGKEELE